MKRWGGMFALMVLAGCSSSPGANFPQAVLSGPQGFEALPLTAALRAKFPVGSPAARLVRFAEYHDGSCNRKLMRCEVPLKKFIVVWDSVVIDYREAADGSLLDLSAREQHGHS